MKARPRPKCNDSAPDLCRRCGACCFEKLILDDLVLITDVPCPHLDLGTRLCTIYPRRFELYPRCATAPQALQAGALPADCPYVLAACDPAYRPAEFMSDYPELEEEFADEIRELVDPSRQPPRAT